jgi:hypothetical protein
MVVLVALELLPQGIMLVEEVVRLAHQVLVVMEVRLITVPQIEGMGVVEALTMVLLVVLALVRLVVLVVAVVAVLLRVGRVVLLVHLAALLDLLAVVVLVAAAAVMVQLV